MASGTFGRVLGLGFLAAFGTAGYLVYERFAEKDRVIEEQKRVIADLGQRLDRAWAHDLVADVRVNRIGRDPDSGLPELDLTFIQYQPGTETALYKRRLLLHGQEFYVDALVVKFERSFVEQGDGLRGKSLLLFRRAFGDQQKPADGPLLVGRHDTSLIPEAAQVDPQPSPFEQQIWTRFWQLANDPRKAAEQGIAVIQGEAPHVRAIAGQVYKLTLRRSGGLDIRPRLPAAALEEPTSQPSASPSSSRPHGEPPHHQPATR